MDLGTVHAYLEVDYTLIKILKFLAIFWWSNTHTRASYALIAAGSNDYSNLVGWLVLLYVNSFWIIYSEVSLKITVWKWIFTVLFNK